MRQEKEKKYRGSLLVVDDNEMNRDMLSRRLGRKGYEVDVARDGNEALEKIATDNFDLILLDIMMPGMSGLEVLEQVRTSKSVADLPIIMATAKTESADIVEALKLGANDYVTKPLDFPVVLARVGAQMGLKQANEEIKRLASEIELRNQFIREVFGRYLSNDIVTRLLETPEGLSLGGEKREVTILMCDIRGFSVLSAALEPVQVVAMVNNFLSVMTEVILEYGGTIDEFIGDAILVLFGAPIETSDHAESAVACALAMQLAMDQVNARNRAQDLPEVAMGVGINTGQVVVGNIGSDKRAKYGVVGANVNLAARIEGYTLGGQILISEATRSQVTGKLVTASQLQVRPKGSDDDVLLHDVRALEGRHQLSLPEDECALRQPVASTSAEIRLISGKDLSDQSQTCAILGLSETRVVVESEGEFLQSLANVALVISVDGAATRSGRMFAKVTAAGGEQATMAFTSLTYDDREFIGNLLSGATP